MNAEEKRNKITLIGWTEFRYDKQCHKTTVTRNGIKYTMDEYREKCTQQNMINQERENIINRLIKLTPDLRFDIYGMNGNQPIWADNYMSAISQSKIGLNLSQGKATKYYSSDRFSQLIGNGLLVMIDEKTKMNDFFNKNEIVLYKNISDLSEKLIKYSFDNKLRSSIAKKGRDKYFKYFNSTTVADFIISKTFNINKKFFWEKIN